MKYIAIMFLFVFLLAQSNIANSGSLFESDFVKIEIKTDNAYKTKLNSIEEIKIKSLFVIINRILDNDNKIKFAALLNNNNFINELIQNIIIENEIITNQKYIAEIKVNYDKKKIINILRNYKINYTDIKPTSYLVISSYNQEFINIGLEKNNPFLNQFRHAIDSNNFLLNYFFPNLDPNDRYILSYDKMVIEDKKTYRKLLSKYDVDKALYIKINRKNSKSNLKILIKIFDKNLNKFIQIKEFEYSATSKDNIETFNLLSKNILYELDNWWKKENHINNSVINSIECIIKSNNFNDFIFIKSNINDLSQVLIVKPIKIETNNSIEMIKYYGNIDILTKSLYSRGINLIDSDNCLISSHLS